MTAPALDRALQVITTNQYLTLATVDGQGPWCAALAYRLGPPACLYFFSQHSSRHVQAIQQNPRIAGVIYNSALPPEQAESIQFEGRADIVADLDTYAFVLKEKPRPDAPDASREKAQTLHKDPNLKLVRLTLNHAYVLDQDLYAAKQVDGRQPVNVEDLFRRLTSPR